MSNKWSVIRKILGWLEIVVGIIGIGFFFYFVYITLKSPQNEFSGIGVFFAQCSFVIGLLLVVGIGFAKGKLWAKIINIIIGLILVFIFIQWGQAIYEKRKIAKRRQEFESLVEVTYGIVKGYTTMQEVEQILGKPYHITHSTAPRTIYWYSNLEVCPPGQTYTIDFSEGVVDVYRCQR